MPKKEVLPRFNILDDSSFEYAIYPVFLEMLLPIPNYSYRRLISYADEMTFNILIVADLGGIIELRYE